jgi:hypothetical protein
MVPRGDDEAAGSAERCDPVSAAHNVQLGKDVPFENFIGREGLCTCRSDFERKRPRDDQKRKRTSESSRSLREKPRQDAPAPNGEFGRSANMRPQKNHSNRLSLRFERSLTRSDVKSALRAGR